MGARHCWARACQGTQGKHRAARPRCACCPRPVTGAWSRLSPSVADAKGARPCSWGISSRPGRRTGRRSWRCWGSRGDPVGPVRLKVLPDDVGKELVGGLAGVEAIDGLDGAAGVAVLLHVLGEERLPVDVQAVHLESVRVVVVGDDLVVDLGEVVGTLLGEGAKGVVGGEPAVAGVGPNTGEGGAH